MNDKKNIGNVNVLDIRNATEATIAQIGKIGNANVVLYTPETAGLLSQLNFGNLNVSIEVPKENVQFLTSKTTFNHDYFKNKSAPEFLVVTGKLIVDADVLAEDIENKLAGLALLGKIICPQNLLGALQSKSKMNIGKFAAYPPMGQVRIGDILLDEGSLNTFEDHTELAVVGNVTFPDVLPNDLLERKIARLFAFDGVKCHAENAAVIQRFLHKDTPNITTIPAGHEWIEKPVVLDSLTLSLKKGRKLYCNEVLIDPDVTPALLDEGLAALVSEDMVICPVGLKETLIKKCDPMKTRFLFYEGTLWLVENEEKLYKSFLEGVEGKLTVFVRGALTIEPDVEAKQLAEKLAKIHNQGAIFCRPEQMGIINLRLGLKEGAVLDSTPHAEEPKNEDAGIGNANFLAL